MDEMNLKSLAKIGKGTKRKKRDINLLEVAEEMKFLYDIHKSLDEVAKVVRLSPEMVRQFLKITELNVKVKELIKRDLIRGVDICYRISKLREKDQIVFAKEIASKNIPSEDVRAIVKYKIVNSKMPINKVINKVLKSKVKKIYVAYLGIEKDIFENLQKIIKNKDIQKTIKSFFNRVVPAKYIVSLELNGRVVIIKVLKEGLFAMRTKSKELKVPLAKLGNALVREYMQEPK